LTAINQCMLKASIVQVDRRSSSFLVTFARYILMAPKSYRYHANELPVRFAGESWSWRWESGKWERSRASRRDVRLESLRNGLPPPHYSHPWSHRTYDLYDFYTPFPRSSIPPGGIPYSQGREERGSRRPSARKSGAFHTLFMKYIFQQNSSTTTCTQPRSDKIDGNVYIRGDVKKIVSDSSVVYSTTRLRGQRFILTCC